jgi:hypothetical protein
LARFLAHSSVMVTFDVETNFGLQAKHSGIDRPGALDGVIERGGGGSLSAH